MHTRRLICAVPLLAAILATWLAIRDVAADEPAPSEPKFTAEQQARLDEANQLLAQVDELYKKGQTRQAIAPAKKALTIRQEVLGEKHLDTATTLNNLAFLQNATGDRDGARQNYQQALAIRREILGDKHPGTAQSLINLGAFLESTVDYAGARSVYEQALAIRKEALGEKHPDTADAFSHLGHLLQAMGDYAAARPHHEQALAINKEALGVKHHVTAISLNNLALLLEDMGDYAAARPLLEQALAIKQEILGPKHPSTAMALNNLGYLLAETGDRAAARPYYEQALAIRQEVLGETHLETAQSLNNLGALLKDMGNYAAARTYYEKALAIKRELLGPKHPGIALSLNNLGNLLQATGDYRAAEDYYRQALAIRREALGEMHPDVAESLNNLATVREDLGDFSSALSFYQQALAIKRKALGEKHPGTAKAIHNLGGLSHHTGDYAASRNYYEQALATNIAALGEHHPDVAVSLGSLGMLLHEMGDNVGARDCLEKALAINRATLGEKHPDTADSLEDLGELARAAKDYAAARVYYEQALATRREVLGDKHRATAWALSSLGALLRDQGDFESARSYYEQTLAICREVLGDKHPDTGRALNNLGGLLQDMGDFDAARPSLEEALAIFENTYGQTHPVTAMPRDHLSNILATLGQWPQAAAQMDQSRRIVRRHIARVLPGFSETEQLAFLSQNDAAPYHAGLTMGLRRRHDAALAARSAEWLINDKGVAQEALAQRALLVRETKDDALAERAQELVSIRRQLATLSMTSPTPERAADWRARINRLQQDENTLARELSLARGQTAVDDPWVELNTVRQALDPGAMLIEIARFLPYDFSAKKRSDRWQPARYAAWIIPPAGEGDVRVVDLGEAAVIEQAVAAARKTWLVPRRTGQRGLVAEQESTEEEKTFREAPARLAALVLEPILTELGDTRHWIVCPDAALWLVPFGALPLADGRYAIQEYQIDYLTSSRDLVPADVPDADKAPARTSRPVVMADPDYDLNPDAVAQATSDVLRQAAAPPADQLALRSVSSDRGTIGRAQRLPGTAKEAAAIVPWLTELDGEHRRPTLYQGRFALEGVFKALSRPRMVVLSTHGFFLSDQEPQLADAATSASAQAHFATPTVDGKPLENPLLRCGLLLAGCNQRHQIASESAAADDGILTGMEIIGTDLRGTELVVLSACETGLGEVHNGEGVAGLRQAFQLAGARAVVASLWQVPDEQTAELMGLFFADLADQQSKLGKSTDRRPSKAEALRKAQIKMIETHKGAVGSEPFYWAAFTLTGR